MIAICVLSSAAQATHLVMGTNGIIVYAAPTDVVTLRNLSINGFKFAVNGIHYLAGGGLHIENCNIFGFIQDEINVAPPRFASRYLSS
jgi:hypothetical protein